ncbi:hypothetical protein T492DRAFT_1138646 [Pavlovales sp. CCMP2436]|nr:hypothetical protein T492DRAFT_1138646 [Pavlovales sp. CCMP2436]
MWACHSSILPSLTLLVLLAEYEPPPPPLGALSRRTLTRRARPPGSRRRPRDGYAPRVLKSVAALSNASRGLHSSDPFVRVVLESEEKRRWRSKGGRIHAPGERDLLPERNRRTHRSALRAPRGSARGERAAIVRL